jgi:hypothetical protein
MSFKDPGLGERLAGASTAKKATLEKFNRAKLAAEDPAALERRAKRTAVDQARKDRAVAREASRANAEEAERKSAIERDAQDLAAAATQRERETVEAAVRAERDADLDVGRKAARDARYAARKARK